VKQGASDGAKLLHGDEHLWSVVLAGGEGERIRPFIRERLGEDRPKQYCTFIGTRSLLQHTIDRADALTSPERRIVVAARHHEEFVREQMGGREEGRIVFQPRNRGTGPGILLALTYVLAKDVDARVIVYPSDHFIHPEERFARVVGAALAASDEMEGRTVLLGVRPDDSEGDYGWIQPGPELRNARGGLLWSIERFVEKPGRDAIRSAANAFWNTFVMVSSIQSLWGLGWRHVPELMPLFVELWDSIDRPEEPAVLERIYRSMPERNFSSEVLARGVERLALMGVEGVHWSDWGRGERVLETLDRLGLEAPFAAA
jgi:mannose-1-phosphate guanylyltransferase